MLKSIALLLCVVAITGCAGSAPVGMEERGFAPAPAAHENHLALEQDLRVPERQVILSGHVRMEVWDADSIHGLMIDLAGEYDGYILLSRDNMTTIRIPATGFDEAMARVENWGEVLGRTVSGSDVSEEYYDLEVRLKNVESTRDRYVSLLAHANTIEEMLRLEKELERLSKRIDLLRGKLNRLQHRVAYATVSVETVARSGERPGPVAAVFQGLYRGAKWLFVRK